MSEKSHDVVLRSHDHDASPPVAHINTVLFSNLSSPSLSSPHIPPHPCQTKLASPSPIRQLLPSRYLHHLPWRPSHSLLIFQPDSEKSTPEHLGDKIKGKTDRIASKVQPEVCRFVLDSTIRGTNLCFRVRSPLARKSVTRSRLTMEETM